MDRNVDPATVAASAAAVAATAAVQALRAALQPVTLSQHKLALPSFWTEDPAEWFQHAEAKFTLARLTCMSATSTLYVHCLWRCSPLYETSPEILLPPRLNPIC